MAEQMWVLVQARYHLLAEILRRKMQFQKTASLLCSCRSNIHVAMLLYLTRLETKCVSQSVGGVTRDVIVQCTKQEHFTVHMYKCWVFLFAPSPSWRKKTHTATVLYTLDMYAVGL